jgi:hypothetical protein
MNHETVSSSYILVVVKPRRVRLAGYVACMRKTYNILKKRNRLLAIPRRTSWFDIKMYPKENVFDSAGWIHLAQNTVQRQIL